jgi:hypothetical protein
MKRSSRPGRSPKHPSPKKQAPAGYLQRAETLIKANQTAAAHRFLLIHARAHFRDPRLWQMLARTAPNPSAANEYYHMLALLKPSKARVKTGQATTRTYAQDVDQIPENLTATHTFIHTASYPSSPARQPWLQRLLHLFRRDRSRPKHS